MEKTEDDLLVEEACGFLAVSKFEFFDRALTWDRGTRNPSAAAIDYNVYEHTEHHDYPAYVLGYAAEVVRAHRADRKKSGPFTNVRRLYAHGHKVPGSDKVVDLNRVRHKKQKDKES